MDVTPLSSAEINNILPQVDILYREDYAVPASLPGVWHLKRVEANSIARRENLFGFIEYIDNNRKWIGDPGYDTIGAMSRVLLLYRNEGWVRLGDDYYEWFSGHPNEVFKDFVACKYGKDAADVDVIRPYKHKSMEHTAMADAFKNLLLEVRGDAQVGPYCQIDEERVEQYLQAKVTIKEAMDMNRKRAKESYGRWRLDHFTPVDIKEPKKEWW